MDKFGMLIIEAVLVIFVSVIRKERLLFLNLQSQIIFLQCLWLILMARGIQRKY